MRQSEVDDMARSVVSGGTTDFAVVLSGMQLTNIAMQKALKARLKFSAEQEARIVQRGSHRAVVLETEQGDVAALFERTTFLGFSKLIPKEKEPKEDLLGPNPLELLSTSSL